MNDIFYGSQGVTKITKVKPENMNKILHMLARDSAFTPEKSTSYVRKYVELYNNSRRWFPITIAGY